MSRPMPSTMIKTVILDKDGVLLDLSKTWVKKAVKMTKYIADLTKGEYTAEFFQNIISVNEDTQIIDPNGLFAAGESMAQKKAFVHAVPMLEQFLINNKQVDEELQNIFLADDGNKPMSNGDVVTPLTILKQQGYRLAVLTNDEVKSAKYGLKHIGVETLIDYVIGCDSGFGGKPEPHGLLAICRYFDTKPQEAVMVGDTYADRKAADAAGARFIGVVGGEFPIPHALKGVEHRLVGGLGELPKIVGGMKS